MTHVLLVDDEQPLLRALSINLRARKYDVDTADDGATALATASRHPPDLIILDLGLPDMSGVEVVTGLRGWCEAPIIVLSAHNTHQDKVAALDAGADDYVASRWGSEAAA
jgi:two-component system KDP operon response regulator KdpE